MARYGKIARLPRNIRDELNRRLDNNESGVNLLAWLNSLPEVKQVLDKDFDGREISDQNLSDWKQGGFLDWQGQRETVTWIRELKANEGEVAEASGGDLADCLAAVVAARYAVALQGWNGEPSDEMRRQLRALRGICREVVRLRRSDQGLERTKIQREWLALDRQKTEASIRTQSETLAFNQRCYQDSKRSDEERALSVCLDDTTKYPEVREAFKQTFAALRKAKGIS